MIGKFKLDHELSISPDIVPVVARFSHLSWHDPDVELTAFMYNHLPRAAKDSSGCGALQ
ncbi:hypothetical protein BKA66DRAFT_477540 [Pyrenochaeta sp. MPI-SDFR-AT-0127]|nr:hypothetical protein BKA66DRAFT_477540 [Pyrenochaeta sp. MPI-SDFR-AT-0127]